MKKEIELFKVSSSEVWAYMHNNVWYELHVNGTDERTLGDVFNEKGDLIVSKKFRSDISCVIEDEELIRHFEYIVNKINH